MVSVLKERTARRRGVAAVLCLTLVLAVVVGFKRWTVTDWPLGHRLVATLARAPGLALEATGPVRLRLLPRPTVDLGRVSGTALGGTLRFEAEGLRLQPSLLPLLAGRLRRGAVVLDSPTVVIDRARGPVRPDALAAAWTALGLDSLAVHDGVVRLTAPEAARDVLLTECNGVLAWPTDGREADLSGSATWGGVSGDLDINVDHPDEALAGRPALASVHLRSSLLDLVAVGSVSGGGDTRASGRVTASTSDLPALLARFGMSLPQIGRTRQARLSGTATLGPDSLALADLSIDLEADRFEGALVLRRDDGRLGLAGTLATDRVVLDTYLAALPRPLTADGGWNTTPFDLGEVAADRIDLRVSANTAVLGPFTMEDGSLSLQSGDGRMELSLGEARAYDGLLKGRLVATVSPAGASLRVDATLSRLDLAKLLQDAPGGYTATGTLTGHTTLEGRGASPDEIVHSLSGRGQMALRNGTIGGDLASTLVQPATSLGAAGPVLTGGTPVFDDAMLDFTVGGGWLALRNSAVAWPTARTALSGWASLPDRSLDIHAAPRPEDMSDAEFGYDITGPWRNLRLQAARGPRL